ncbi:hypothetical protein [Clostridium polynesiense]|uniref:lysine 5,6-aminomutase reactivase subunit KamB n=1 Tax=Clostridium polynesiense TaxID=1325933 RepID=UPI00058D204B|nr:hypothetical protein [Clostridium polynesiense]
MKPSLRSLIKDYNSISIMGMCKNAGKTEVFNYILKETSKEDIILGITSIGRDGEEVDAVTLTKKPRIYINKNTILATARQSLSQCDFTKEVLYTTGINTPMGEIVLLKALSCGYADLSGPSTLFELSEVMNKLKELGASKLLIDGALSRKSLATPNITDGCILAAGAALNSSMEKVIDDTVHTVRLFSLDAIKDSRVKAIAEAHGENNVVVIIDKDYHTKKLSVISSLHSSKEILENLESSSRYIVINGSVTDRLLMDLFSVRELLKDIFIIIKDSTKLMVSKEVFEKFMLTGARIAVLRRINLLAVTINPTSPSGYEFNGEVFKDSLEKSLSVPVFNIFSE